MTAKIDIVEAIHKNCALSMDKSKEAFEAIIDSIKESLYNGNPVIFRNFGRFNIRYKAKRKGRNPRTGAQAVVQARRVPYFKAGKRLKSKVNP